MKRETIAILAVSLLIGALPATAQTGAPGATNPPPDYSKIFKTDKDKVSYAMGMNYGFHLKSTITNQDIEADIDTIVKAFKDSLTGASMLINEEQERDILMAFTKDLQDKQNAKRKQTAEKNKTLGASFLEKNKTAPGVITLASGLQYKVISEGSGAPPKATDIVKVNYRGTLIDGTEFDSSKGTPVEFPVNGVIKGWTEALQLMKPGAKWQLFIPSDLAYGEMGQRAIEANSTLVFDVELVSFKNPPPPPAPGQGGMASSAPLTSDIVRVPSAEAMKRGEKIETIKAADLEKEKEKVNK